MGALPESRLGEFLDGILVAELVCGEVHCAEAPPSNLLLDNVLVDAMDRASVVVGASIVTSGIEGGLYPRALARGSLVVSDRRLIHGRWGGHVPDGMGPR